MNEITASVLVIGGGPAGYVCAIRAGQLGLEAVLVEQDKAGGTCLNVGCIPSKALIHAADAFHAARSSEGSNAFGLSISAASLDFGKTIAWKDNIVRRLTGGVTALLKKGSVRVIEGHANIEDGKTCVVSTADGELRVRAAHVVLATGSEPAVLADMPFGGNILSSTDALALTEVPRNLVVIGAGYIGLELGTAFAKMGARVAVVEAADKILPAWDEELTRPVAKRLESLGVEVHCRTFAEGLSDDGLALKVKHISGDRSQLPADKVLVAIGRAPRTRGFGLERLDLTLDGPFVAIDRHCATSMRNVWAIGDLTGEPMLAHRAMAQGKLVAELIAGQRRQFDYRAIPAVCFTDPEIVAVGTLPEPATTSNGLLRTVRFPFAANGRALTQGDDIGFIRVVTRADNGLVVGVQAVGACVSELAASFALAIEMAATVEDIAGTIHAHPTRGEAFQEAAFAAAGHALHI